MHTHRVAACIMAMLLLALASCGGGGSGKPAPAPSTTANALAITVDGQFNTINVPFVSVTVCVPGTTTCQTIDHVLVDTGSWGLRLINNGSLNVLPAVTNSSGTALGECTQFADGFTWGSVRYADIKLAGEVALHAAIQSIGDQPGGASGVPADCSGTGINENTAALLGAKGILGVGLFTNDCDACLISNSTNPIPPVYYACTGAACSNTLITPSQMVQNPVSLFPQDNNGVVLDLPAVGNGGTASLSGTLYFGIGTQANNTLGRVHAYQADYYGDILTSYKGVTTSSFIDSGSNGIFFADSAITQCTLSLGFYCPSPSPLPLTATNIAASGGASGNISFNIVSVDALSNNVAAGNIGGNAAIFGWFDWGLPLFFGRKIYFAIENASTALGAGPYYAY